MQKSFLSRYKLLVTFFAGIAFAYFLMPATPPTFLKKEAIILLNCRNENTSYSTSQIYRIALNTRCTPMLYKTLLTSTITPKTTTGAILISPILMQGYF